MKKFSFSLIMMVSILVPTIGWSADGNALNLTNHWLGITALVIFVLAYLLVMAEEFFALFLPSAVNFLIPATVMHFAIPNTQPDDAAEVVQLKVGAKRVVILFLLTIVTAVSFHNFLHLPPVIGMLTGLSYLQFLGYYLKKRCEKARRAGASEEELSLLCSEGTYENGEKIGNVVAFDIF